MAGLKTIAIILLIVTLSSTQLQRYRLCVPYTMVSECENLERADSEVSCVLVQDSTDCALKLNAGQVDFGKFSAEQAMVASYYLKEGSTGVVVIGDIRDEERKYDQFAFSAVALARRKSVPSGNLGREKGLKYCHPGVGRTRSGWSDRVLKELDLAVLDFKDARTCDEWRSELENEIVGISKIWGDSCRPGTWSADEELDKSLKSQNENLCALCPDKATCSYGDDESDPHSAAMECLTKGGDVAFVDRFYAKDIISNMNSNSEYALVCPDLSVGTNISTCHWAQQPWSSIVASSKISVALAQKLVNWLKPLDSRELGVTEPTARRQGGWQLALIDILLDDYQRYEMIGEMTVKRYIARGRRIPDLATEHSCTGPARWCTLLENELAKCNWLSTSALTAGVVPPIKCVSAESGQSCAKLLGNHQADITVNQIDDAYIASTWTSQTSNVAIRVEANKFVETSSDKHNNIVILVHKDYQLNNVTELKDKKACFPVKDGVAYASFLKYTMELKELSTSCPYEQAVDDYFGASCVPGVAPNATDLCELCQSNTNPGVDPYGYNKPPNKCAAHGGNLFYGNIGALRCLHSGGGDVAYVDLGAVREAIQLQTVPGIKEHDFKVVCGTGQVTPVTRNGLTGAEECALITVPAGAVLSRASLEPHAKKDINNLLMACDSLFGTPKGNHPEPVFRMYRPFNGTKGLIFPFGTVGLLAKDSNIPAVAGYTTLQVKVPQPCGSGHYNAAPTQMASLALSIISTLFIVALKSALS